MSEKTKQVVRRYFEELDRTKASPVDLIAPGFTFQAAGFPAMDLEGTEQFTDLFFSAFPDLTHPVDELIAEGDRVAFRCRYEGELTPEKTSWESRPAGDTSRPSAPASCVSSTTKLSSSGSLPTG